MELYWQAWKLLGRRIKDSCVARLDRALNIRAKPCPVRQLLENFLHQNPEFSDVKLRNRLIDRNMTFIYITMRHYRPTSLTYQPQWHIFFL